MRDFSITALPPEAFDPEHMHRVNGVRREQCDYLVQQNLTTVVYENGTYQVNVRSADLRQWAHELEWPPMVHLSIKRFDRAPIHDWRVMQEIKNKILGPEHEAVELYPAESRLTDTANQYHLWCFKDAAARFPFGYFDGRNVNGNDGKVKRMRATQRDL